MTWIDRVQRVTATWHWDADAQLLCLGSHHAADPIADAPFDEGFWSAMVAAPIVQGL